ncbi:MAG: hypothetical protein ACI4Q9_03395 [Candidatus Methanomethylophilaceae archaeon]
MPKIMGLVMLAYVVLSIIWGMKYDGYDVADMLDINGIYITSTISNAFLFIGGVAILLWRHITLTNTAAIYLVCVGSGRLVTSISYMFSEVSTVFFFGMILMCLAANMIVSGVFYLRGISRNRTNTMLTVTALVVLYAAMILIVIRATGEVYATLRDNLNIVLQILMYLMLLALLDTESVRRNSPMEHVDACVGSAAACICASKDTMISEDEARRICKGFTDPGTWDRVNDGGPATYQYSFELSGRDQNMKVLVQRWEGSSKLYFTLAKDFDTSLVHANRLAASYYVLENNTVEDSSSIMLFDDDGRFMRFSILHKSLTEYLDEREVDEDENRCPR